MMKASFQLADDLTLADQWIVQKYNETVQSVTSNLDKFELVKLQVLYMISFGTHTVTGILS